ncbi:uncharacterized protein LOC134279078 [Saccostrea cucullata]|uniref:uncharacterized protein LOC134279078 n=1 Tax=Saccostrea cuccullata TaxID=36930 RepID=UPI002ED48B1C
MNLFNILNFLSSDLHNLDLKKWEEEDTFYQETHSFPSMMQKVRDQPYVIFVGVPGSGKSATARHIALKLKSENYQVLPINDIRKIEDYCDTNNPQVFVMEDALGVYGLQQSELNIILRYKDRIITPINENSKLLLTCREIVFNEVLCHNVFLAEDNNVIKLCNSEHDLNDHDKKLILKKYGLDEDLMTSSELRSASPMFPLLCKLFVKDQKFRSLGSKFFKMPVQCFLDELDNMRSENKINYATLIICMMNGDMLSKEILRDKNNAQFMEMKKFVLESCKVESHTDTFKFMDALSAMKGTYTKESGAEYSFIHDYIYEICAFHYGQQFLDQILRYMDSCYIANYVIAKNVKASTRNAGEDTYDLYLRLNEDQYPMFAERLYRDIQELKLYDVFMNDSLKHPQVIKAFIDVLQKKPYSDIKSLFLSKQESGLHLVRQGYHLITESQKQSNVRSELKRLEVLMDENLHYKTNMISIRVISWVIMYGHCQILQQIVQQTENHGETKRELFMENQDSRHPHYENIISEMKQRSNTTDLSMYCKYIEQTRLLVLACYSGDVDTVKTILPHMDRESIDSICLSNIHTPLIVACQSGVVQVVEELINAGAHVEQQDLQGNTPLVTACKCGHEDVMEKLLSVGADINHPDGRGRRPLVVACQDGHLMMVKKLVNLNADVNLKYGDRNPLLVCCNEFVKEMVTFKNEQWLWKTTPMQENDRYTPLVAASEGGYLSLVNVLVKAGGEVNLQDGAGNTPLVTACKNGHLSVVEELVKLGADVNLSDGMGDIALVSACNDGNLKMCNLLLNIGADVNKKNKRMKTPLVAALEQNSQSWVQSLMKHLHFGGLVNLHATVLHFAYKINRQDLVNALLKFEDRIDLNLNLFNTLVFIRHASVKMDSKDDVVISKRNAWWMVTKLWTLIRTLDSDGLSNLLQGGLDVNLQIHDDKNSYIEARPLLHILLNERGLLIVERVEKVRILLQAGADVNVRAIFREDDNIIFSTTFDIFFRWHSKQKNYPYYKLDWKSGVSALRRSGRIFNEYSNFADEFGHLFFEKRDEYKSIIHEIKKHVRRYSI